MVIFTCNTNLLIMAITITEQARNLVKELGKEEAIKWYESEIESRGEPINFTELCKEAAQKSMIEYIKKEF